MIGDANHPEVIALIGWTRGTAVVVENVQEAIKLPFFPKIGAVAQTTQTESNFWEVIEVLRKKTEDLIVHNTICHATRDRQEAAVKLAGKVNLMIVVGGRNSPTHGNWRRFAGTGTERTL